MKIAILLSGLFACAIVSSAPAFAQFQINDAESGSQVNIGPGGITTTTRNGNKVTVGPGALYGISGSSGNTVQMGPGGINVTKYGSSGRPKKGSAAYRSSGQKRSIIDEVSDLEVRIYSAKKSGNLIVRVNALETDVLGSSNHPGTLESRVAVLKQSVSGSGGTTNGTVTTVVRNNNSQSTISVGTPGAVTVEHGGSIIVSDENARSVINTNKSSVVVNSNNCHLTINGVCAELVVNGNNNTIECQNLIEVVTNGNKNSVFWHNAKAPDIANNGNGNSLSRSH